MMLLHKPQPALSSQISINLAHKRQSSAPIVVQPTRIPGLLSLSKPPRPSPPRTQQRRNPRMASKQLLSQSANAHPLARAHAQALTPAAQVNTAPVTPSPRPRGRTQEKNSKEKALSVKRSASQTSLRGLSPGKHNGRQASPTLTPMTNLYKQKPSQAEVSVNFANHFDPFVDQPTLPPSPSRKQFQQSQSKAIPVPVSSAQRPALARSDPFPLNVDKQQRHQQRRSALVSKRALPIQDFPICDDMSEIADDADEPSTPIARRLYVGVRSPLAPPTPTPTAHSSPSPPKIEDKDRSRNRKHRRTPSEGAVFHMSSDEELSSGPGGPVLNSNFKPNVIAPVGPFHTPAGKTKEVANSRANVGSVNLSTSLEKAAFFASSLFQNSPSPDELPDPLLL